MKLKKQILKNSFFKKNAFLIIIIILFSSCSSLYNSVYTKPKLVDIKVSKNTKTSEVGGVAKCQRKCRRLFWNPKMSGPQPPTFYGSKNVGGRHCI